MTSKPQYGGEYQRARKAAKEAMIEGTRCPRCGLPMYRSQDLDFGHAVDVASGGANGPRRLEHSSCNRSAGGKIGGKAAGNHRPKSAVAKPATTTNHGPHGGNCNHDPNGYYIKGVHYPPDRAGLPEW